MAGFKRVPSFRRGDRSTMQIRRIAASELSGIGVLPSLPVLGGWKLVAALAATVAVGFFAGRRLG